MTLANSEEMEEWLSQDENNVLVTHCKAGKVDEFYLFLSKWGVPFVMLGQSAMNALDGPLNIVAIVEFL
jgi:hypothetical protein